MKIFMTGSTVIQANQQTKLPIRKLNVPECIVDTLTGMGHEVNFDVIDIPDALPDGTEMVWFNVSAATSVNAPYALRATWAADLARRQGLPVVIFFDDWQFNTVFSSYRTLGNNGVRQATKTMGGRYFYRGDVAAAAEVYPTLLEFADWFEHGMPTAVPVIPKFFGWGDVSIVTSKMPNIDRVWEIDPTTFTRPEISHAKSRVYEKERRWLLASLMPHEDWVRRQALTWPVDYIGSRRMSAVRLKTEQDVVDEGGKRFGILCPTYPHSGSGWFRTRFLYAAYTQSVLFCGAKDAAAIGSAYEWKTSQIEHLTSDELISLGASQHNVMSRLACFNPQLVVDQLEAILTEAGARVT